VTVTLADGAPQAKGRTWTAEDYAKRDAALATLGLSLPQRRLRPPRGANTSLS
jgi:hypothetical protein